MAANIPESDKVRARHHLNGAVCKSCRAWKVAAEFFPRNNPSGSVTLRQPCKECRKESHAASMQKWRATPAGKASVKATNRAWQDANAEYQRSRSKRRYHTDPKYRAVIRASSSRRRALQAQVRCDVTRDDILELFEEYLGLCVYCLGRADTVDHVVPLVLGGAHTKSNLAPACKSCNSRKHAKPMLVFLAERNF